ncbi:MAG: hypothetical protein HQM12_21960 [SAR324 cluster bacterium]|nr:hypothetical protein [SAR324 cluster bacterium]
MMELQEIIQNEFQKIKSELIQSFQKEIILKIKDDVKDEIIGDIIHEIRFGNREVIRSVDAVGDKVDLVREEIATGNLQTHNLLSNIAEGMNKMNSAQEKMNSTQEKIVEVLTIIAHNTKNKDVL